MIEISVVSPVYRSASIVRSFAGRLINVLNGLNVNYEIILVDDASPDDAWKEIESVASQFSQVKAIQLSRNFGQHYAITAGLDAAEGNWVIVMDSDLQDRPEEIIALYTKANEGYEIVLCSREERTDGWFKKITSKMFYGFLSFITGKKVDHSVANFGIYHRKVISEIIRMRESIRYFPMMVLWVGFHSTTIKVAHGEREEGRSAYNIKKLFKLGIDIILSYSDRPLQLMAATGGIISLVTLIVAIVTLIRYFNHSITVEGYTSLMLSIWFLGGLIIATLGIVGLYVGKTFQGIKNRPLYITRKTINL
jgi:polyisoprenyl-phosphate glycosyltransferase